MNSGSKILIIDDERGAISNFGGTLCSIFPYSEEERENRTKEWRNLKVALPMPKPPTGTKVSQKDQEEYNFKLFNDFWAGIAICPKSFEDAYRLVKDAGTGDDYEWIFIDRNLERYHDLRNDQVIQIDGKEFTPDFFKSSLNGFAGDYFCVMLLQVGVPIEKICFLTANNDDSSINELSKSPYLHDKKLPKVIDKASDELKNILKNSPCAKVRYLYREIFVNKKVNSIFGPYIEDFITILAKQYKSGAAAKFEYKDGITLRNMIETGMPTLAQNVKQGIRSYLNDPANQYNINPTKIANHDKNLQNLHDTWYGMVKESRKDKNVNTLLWTSDNDLNKYLKNINSKVDLNKLKQYDAARFFAALNQLYFGKQVRYGLPPKYIFSYIDNIYTVTSEFSAHGMYAKTTAELSTDGWSALLSGMLQIMQWVAATNPNPQSSQN